MLFTDTIDTCTHSRTHSLTCGHCSEVFGILAQALQHQPKPRCLPLPRAQQDLLAHRARHGSAQDKARQGVLGQPQVLRGRAGSLWQDEACGRAVGAPRAQAQAASCCKPTFPFRFFLSCSLFVSLINIYSIDRSSVSLAVSRTRSAGSTRTSSRHSRRSAKSSPSFSTPKSRPKWLVLLLRRYLWCESQQCCFMVRFSFLFLFSL